MRNRLSSVPLGTVLKQRLDHVPIHSAAKERFVTVRLHGKGAVQRTAKDGGAPSLKSGLRVHSGDLVYSRIDARNGAIALVPPGLDGAIVSKDFPSFTINQDVVIPSFLIRYLSSPLFFEQLKALSMGTTNRQRITESAFCTRVIPLPPLPEQHRIVRILDEADELRNLRAKADERTRDLIPAMFHEMFGGSGQPSRNLGQVAEVVSGVAKGRRFNGQPTVFAPYLRVANVQAGYLDLSEMKTIEALPSEIQKYELKKGDVVMTEGGDEDKLGRGAMLEEDLPGCIHQNHVFRVRVDQAKLLPMCFANYLQTPQAVSYFLGCAKRTTNLASINMTQLRALPVPLPDISLQRKFATRVEQVRAMQEKQAESRRKLDELFESLLYRAFAGEL